MHAFRGTTPLLLASAAALALAACAVGPDYKRPEVALTPAYRNAPPAPSAAAAPLDAWWTGFHDEALTRIVERAEAQNLDLAAARARVLQSRAAARAAGAALAPQVRATGSSADVQQSMQSPIGTIGQRLPGFGRSYDENAVGAAASWEVDLFGGLRRRREAARAEAAARQDEAAAIGLSVAAEAADAYLQVRALQARIAVAERQQGVEQDLVALMTERARQGVSAERELHEAQAELERVRAAIPPLTAALETQANRLDVLMGAQAGTYRAELAAVAPVPEAPTLQPGDGPADLLRRRPDILAAEHRLVAANARIGAAVADYYPKVSISGLLGVDSISADRLFTGSAVTHQIGAGLGWRLFDFGRVDAEVAEARGGEAEALAAYRAAVFRATAEVEDAVTALVQDEARSQALAREIDHLAIARRQAQDAYAGGVTSLVEVRDADRELLTASDQLVQSRAGAARAAVAAFRALGGGWSPPPPRT